MNSLVPEQESVYDWPMYNFAMYPNDYLQRGTPHSAPASGGGSPWGVATQEVMYHPDIEISKFNRGSRGSLNSLSLSSMRTGHLGSAYTPKLMRPATADEQPWNLIPYSMPFADNTNPSGAIHTMAGASFFLRSPTPTKRQRTNQACEKCRERKAKCNGARPTCQRCAARGHICEYAKERRMRGPNKTGRRGSQAGIDEPDEPTEPRDDSPASSRPASRREHKSASASPGPSIAIPTLSNGNLSLPATQPIPHGYRFGQPAPFPDPVWPDSLSRDSSSPDYPTADLQSLYPLSDVSSSSTPITPDRFDYAWPPVDTNSPQQIPFQYGHTDKQHMLPPLPEFDTDSNLASLSVWPSEPRSDALLIPDSLQTKPLTQ